MSSQRLLPLSVLAAMFALAACVTINVYFPAAAAEKAADRVIDNVLGKPGTAPAATLEQSDAGSLAARVALRALDFVVPSANAQEPDIDASSPESLRLQESMKARLEQLRPYYDAGSVGFGSDGFIAVRDANAVPLAERNKLRTLVSNENADRAALYREIAKANNQPQWETQIRQSFAKRWVVRAKEAGWYTEAGGSWTR